MTNEQQEKYKKIIIDVVKKRTSRGDYSSLYGKDISGLKGVFVCCDGRYDEKRFIFIVTINEKTTDGNEFNEKTFNSMNFFVAHDEETDEYENVYWESFLRYVNSPENNGMSKQKIIEVLDYVSGLIGE